MYVYIYFRFMAVVLGRNGRKFIFKSLRLVYYIEY